MQILKTHVDGEWWTTIHEYEGHKLEIKMQPNKGCKIHIWNKDNTKVLKTFRFEFATEFYLLNKAKNWINLKTK